MSRPVGSLLSEEHKKKLSKARIGMRFSKSHKKALSLAARNRAHITSKQQKGRVKSKSEIDKIKKGILKSNKFKNKKTPVSNHKVYKEWHHKKNKEIGLDPNITSSRSHAEAYWKCSKKDCGHIWLMEIRYRTERNLGCTSCSTTILLRTGKNLKYKIIKLPISEHQVFEEWHKSKNKHLNPDEIGAYSHQIAYWICINNKKHQWVAPIHRRTVQGSGCPYCRMGHSSRPEIYLLFELKRFFIIDPQDRYIQNKTQNISCDIIIRKKKTVIEYDGAYYHKSDQNRNADIKKNKLLRKIGWKVIRVREKPLKKINRNDILIEKVQSKNFAPLINTVMLLCKYLKVKNKDLKKIYKQNKLVNQSKADKFIKDVRKGKINITPKRGIDPKKVIDDLTILKWIDIFFEKYKKFPNPKTKNKIEEMKENTWAALDNALWRGNRGLKKLNGGLTKLISLNRDYEHNFNKSKLSINLITKWLLFEFSEKKKWPIVTKDNVLMSPGEKWRNVDVCMRIGARGLKKGNSVNKLLKKILNKNADYRPTY